MKIRTNATADQVRAAAREARVSFERFDVTGSRTHAHTFDVLLLGHTSNRRPNSGYRGAGDEYAATWDEWGIFLARIFDADPTTRATYYDDAEHFHWVTGDRFRTLTHDEQHVSHHWDYDGKVVTGSYDVSTCRTKKGECGAIVRRMTHGHKFSEIKEVV